MRRIILPFLLLIISGQASFGKSVDENTAKTIGSNFFITQGKQVKPSDIALTYQATSDINGSSVTDFYVFNAGNSGFVIISGDDNVTPVLAYDLESTFSYNSLYVNINDWLNTYKKEISYVIKNDIAPAPETTQKWIALQNSAKSAARTTSTTTVGPLVHSAWSQSPYVNALCPYSAADSAHAVTGCVATAMAQVMKYWGWPVTGTGYNSYHSSFGELSANFAASTYKWDSMPLHVTDTNYLNVAKVMYDAGVSVDMNSLASQRLKK